MSVASFTKNFKVSKANASAFTKLMTEPAKPLLPKGYQSSFVNLKDNPLLKKQLAEAMNNMNKNN